MEASTVLPPGAVHAPDLAEVTARNGPFLTVHMATEGGVEYAARRSEQRWKSLRRTSTEAGAPEPVVNDLAGLIAGAHVHGDGIVVIADTQRMLHVEHGPAPVVDRATWAPLPRLDLVLQWRQDAIPYVLALVDRVGADLFAVRREGPVLRAEVEGEDHFVTKVKAGGWSQHRYQEHAENVWDENAHLVAEGVERLVRQVEARLLVIAGDVRAVGLLRQHLPDDLVGRIEIVEGEYRWDGEGDPIPDEVQPRVRGMIEHETEQLLALFRQELGQGDLATEGVARVADSLARAQGAVLLLAEEDFTTGGRTGEERQLWFGPEPVHLSADPADLVALGVEEPQHDGWRDVLIRAALGTDAGVRLVRREQAPEDGAGLILRWTTD